MSTNNSSFDTMLLGLIENIRNEISSLNEDLHGLEINLKSIDLLDQKNNHLHEKIVNVVSKMEILEQKLDELMLNSTSKDVFQKDIEEMNKNIDTLRQRCDKLEKTSAELVSSEKIRSSREEKIQQFIIAIILALFGTFLSWYFK